ncbi:migration and invasion-inhibitory protein isoform X7 [Equus asinus]|uniref:migration and invasion-inhibitory protein isoform X7 n=1 Tax=Equus asinus TaxID=9793 RepID=UPI001D056929|nr:migration and invasion-inhibitory protein isoform X4 [Equus asinus]
MVETKDVRQLRQLSLELLRQLRAGQEAVRRSVAKAASASSLDSSSSYDSETPPSQEMSSMASRASCPQDAQQGDPCDMSWPGGASSWGSSPPPTKCRNQESLGPLRPHSAPLPASSDSNDPELSAELDSLLQEAQAMRSAPDQQSKLPKPRVTFKKESPVPERIWRLRPYLGYDWIAGSLDNSSPVTSKPEAFFSKLQKFREANQEECVCSDPEPQILGLREGGGVKGDHECVYCYRVNRRLFLVPSDPGTPCRLCRTPRDQRGPETLAEPAQVRVSVPLSVLDPPHQYRIHRRKSFDASDTLALPRHCLLGWDILPPKPEKSSALKSLDLWSCVSAKAQHQKLSATSPSRLVGSRLPREGQRPWSRPADCRVPGSRIGGGTAEPESVSPQGPIPPALTPSILPGPTTPRQLLHPTQEGPAHAGPTCHPDLVRTPGPLTLRPPAEALRTGHLEEDSASVIVSSLSPLAGAPSPASAGVDSGPTS